MEALVMVIDFLHPEIVVRIVYFPVHHPIAATPMVLKKRQCTGYNNIISENAAS